MKPMQRCRAEVHATVKGRCKGGHTHHRCLPGQRWRCARRASAQRDSKTSTLAHMLPQALDTLGVGRHAPRTAAGTWVQPSVRLRSRPIPYRCMSGEQDTPRHTVGHSRDLRGALQACWPRACTGGDSAAGGSACARGLLVRGCPSAVWLLYVPYLRLRRAMPSRRPRHHLWRARESYGTV
jgi:hypothetical protein